MGTLPKIAGFKPSELKEPIAFCKGVLGHSVWKMQAEILNSIRDNRRTAVKSCHASGKTFISADAALWWVTTFPDGIVVTTAPCYDDQTEILTDSGWKLFVDLEELDLVAQVYPDGKLEFITPLERLRFTFEGDMIGYESQLVDFLVTPNHRCWVDPNVTSRDFEGEVKLAEELYGRNCRVRRSVSWSGSDTGASEDWAEFLGYFFAEGYVQHDCIKKRFRVVINTKKDVEYARDLFVRNGLVFSESERIDGMTSFNFSDKSLSAHLITFGNSSHTRRVPCEIKEAGPSIIAKFLYGYLVGDGTLGLDGSEGLCTCSEELAGDLQELYLKSGVVANVYRRDNAAAYERGQRHSPLDSFTVRAWKKRGAFPQLKAPSPSVRTGWYKQAYSGHVFCVHVPTKLVLVRRNGKTLVCGQTWTQVEKLLWGEIRNSVQNSSKLIYPKVNTTELKLGEKNYAIGLSTNESGRFAGFHSGRVLIIMDEAPGVRPEVWEAVQGLRAGGDVRVLAIGNPLSVGGTFHDAFTSARSGWSTHTINAFDTPNLQHVSLAYTDAEGQEVKLGSGPDLMELSEEQLDKAVRPYLCTRRWVKEMYDEWGPEHGYFQSRVLGEFPTESDDTLIPLSWLERQRVKEAPKDSYVNEKYVAGLDVAGPGEAETVLIVRRGPKVVLLNAWAQPDPRGKVVAALNPYKESLERLNVDSVGMGEYMYRHLKDIFGDCVRPVNVGSAAIKTEKFANAKAEHYWGLRMRVREGDIYFGSELDSRLVEKLIGQTSAIKYNSNPRGQTVIESKEDMRKRGVKSPDLAEALMLAYAGRIKGEVVGLWSGISIGKSDGVSAGSAGSDSLQRESPWRMGGY